MIIGVFRDRSGKISYLLEIGVHITYPSVFLLAFLDKNEFTIDHD